MNTDKNKFEFEGELFNYKDIRAQGGLKKEIVRLVNHAPAPTRECELTDFLMSLQYILDNHSPGELLPEDALVLQVFCGNAEETKKGVTDNYTMVTDASTGQPIVVNERTGKRYTLPWNDIIRLAQAAGVDES